MYFHSGLDIDLAFTVNLKEKIDVSKSAIISTLQESISETDE